MTGRRHQSPTDSGTGEIGAIQNRLANNPRISLTELEALHSECFGWAMSRCRYDADAAEEVLQASYGAIVSGKARYQGRATLKTWLFAVITRQASSHFRSLRYRLRALEQLVTLADPVPADDGDSVDRRVAANAVRRALEQLSRRQRDVIELVFYRDLTVEQAAQVMGVSVGSARQHYARAKHKLSRTLTHEQ